MRSRVVDVSVYLNGGVFLKEMRIRAHLLAHMCRLLNTYVFTCRRCERVLEWWRFFLRNGARSQTNDRLLFSASGSRHFTAVGDLVHHLVLNQRGQMTWLVLEPLHFCRHIRRDP